MISNMQHILKAVEDVQLRYQLANELEFQDVITDLLHGESANFLKDCAASK